MGNHPLIIFQHQPKAGGTSLRTLLMRQFPPEESLNFKGDPVPKSNTSLAPVQFPLNRNTYQRYLETGFPSVPVRDTVDWMHHLAADFPPGRRARYRLLLGHFAYGIHEYFPQPSRYITVLRDPIDRILSLWAIHVRRGIGIGFHEYLETARDGELHDGQMRRLIGTTVPRYRWTRLTADHLELVKERLRGFEVVGTAERYAESLDLLERAFGWQGLTVERLNTTPARIRKEYLSPRLLARLEELNRWDLELHRYANELMDEQLARVGAAGQASSS